MGQLMNFFTPLHKRTSRKYIDRMVDDKVACMLKARGYRSPPPHCHALLHRWQTPSASILIPPKTAGNYLYFRLAGYRAKEKRA